MAKNKVTITLDVDDKGTATINKFDKSVESAFNKIKGHSNASMETSTKLSNTWNKSLSSINFKAVGIAAAAMATAVTYAFTKVTNEVVSAANAQEAAEKRLEAVIKATGQSAGYSADELYKMAAAFQKTTTTGDEVIIAGMSILATFKQIRGEGFERATQAALDMSEVMQQDLKSSMVMIGKAMNDPIANLSAMTRAGVQFTDTQKDMIKELWKLVM